MLTTILNPPWSDIYNFLWNAPLWWKLITGSMLILIAILIPVAVRADRRWDEIGDE